MPRKPDYITDADRTRLIDNLSRAWELVENRYRSDGPNPETGYRATCAQNKAEAIERIEKALQIIRGETSAGTDEQAPQQPRSI